MTYNSSDILFRGSSTQLYHRPEISHEVLKFSTVTYSTTKWGWVEKEGGIDFITNASLFCQLKEPKDALYLMFNVQN